MSEKFKEENLVKLYFTLKSEIEALSKNSTILLVSSITATASILTVGFKAEKPINIFIFFFTFIFIIPVSKMVIGNRKNIWRISTYMRVFIEENENIGLGWESNLHQQRIEDKSELLKSNFVSNEISIFTLLSAITTISVIITYLTHFYLLHNTNYQHFFLPVGICFTAGLIVKLLLSNKHTIKYRETKRKTTNSICFIFTAAIVSSVFYLVYCTVQKMELYS